MKTHTLETPFGNITIGFTAKNRVSVMARRCDDMQLVINNIPMSGSESWELSEGIGHSFSRGEMKWRRDWNASYWRRDDKQFSTKDHVTNGMSDKWNKWCEANIPAWCEAHAANDANAQEIANIKFQVEHIDRDIAELNAKKKQMLAEIKSLRS